MDSSSTHLLVEQQDAVARVTLNRPETRNAFDDTLIRDMTAAYQALSADPTIRVIVLQSSGSAFCAGADLAWMGRMIDYTMEENRADARALQVLFETIATCPAATVASVQGAAIGGGAGLACVCDIAIASNNAVFGLSEVRLGLVPAIIGPYVIERIGVGMARALFLTGERFDAARAEQVGLIHRATPAGDLDSAVLSVIDRLLQAGPTAIRAAKRLIRDISGKSPAEAAGATVECIATLRVGEEGQEGIRAFLAKRTPRFAIESE